MAGDWIQVDHDLLSNPKLITLAELAGCELLLAFGRITSFWIWVDKHAGPDGDLGLRSLAALVVACGADEPFWQAVKAVGWIEERNNKLFCAEWEKRFSSSARERMRKQRSNEIHRSNDGASGSESANGGAALLRHKSADLRHKSADLRHKSATRGEEEESKEEILRASTSSEPRAVRSENATDAQKFQETPAGGQRGLFERAIRWDEAAGDAARIERELAKVNPAALTFHDQVLIVKAAALSQSLGEHWLWDSVEAVLVHYRQPQQARPRGHPCAYFHGVLRSKCLEIQRNFSQLLQAIVLPRGLVVAPARRHVAAQFGVHLRGVG